jgi:dipeptidyl-peptidase 4
VTDWTAAYARAQAVMLTEEKVSNGAIFPHWVGTDCFWYERADSDGQAYVMVDASLGTTTPLLHRRTIADALSRRFGGDIDASQLILANLRIASGGDHATFDAFGVSWTWTIATEVLDRAEKSLDRNWLASPDGARAAFVRDDNLWIRDIASGAERALTDDGTARYSYAEAPLATRTDRARVGARPEALWSPDSRLLLTIQTDERHVPDLPLIAYVPEGGVRPRVDPNPISLPGDDKPTEFRVLIVDVASGKPTEARYPRLSAVRMNDTIFAAGLAWWSADSKTAWFVDIERYEQKAHIVACDVTDGCTRIVFSETTDTYVELSVNVYTPALVFPLIDTDELVWYSERSGHGHLYLYDLNSGTLKHPITSGNWQVRDVHHVDAVRREVFFTAAGISAAEDPYVVKPCIVGIDQGALQILSPEHGDHIIWRPGEYGLVMAALSGYDMNRISGVSPGGDFFVETIGTVDGLPHTVLRARSGTCIMVLEQATAQFPDWWQWPSPVTLKAADGTTDIYGILFKPYGFDPAQSYPVIDYIYGGPQVSYVPKSAFTGGSVGDGLLVAAMLAQLGAFTLVIDGRGTANRERAFREASYGAIETASSLEDHISAIRQLADTHPQIDLDRVGVTGFSGGGYMAAMAALRFGDVFKVAVAGGGNYDQALFWHCWGERYHGPYQEALYEKQAAKTYADGLTGRLMIVHGLLDAGCHPAAVFQLVQALIDANKDVDLVLLPQIAHQMTGYGERRRLDYFVEHLFSSTPPRGIKLTTAQERIAERTAWNTASPKPEAKT